MPGLRMRLGPLAHEALKQLTNHALNFSPNSSFSAIEWTMPPECGDIIANEGGDTNNNGLAESFIARESGNIAAGVTASWFDGTTPKVTTHEYRGIIAGGIADGFSNVNVEDKLSGGGTSGESLVGNTLPAFHWAEVEGFPIFIRSGARFPVGGYKLIGNAFGNPGGFAVGGYNRFSHHPGSVPSWEIEAEKLNSFLVKAVEKSGLGNLNAFNGSFIDCPGSTIVVAAVAAAVLQTLVGIAHFALTGPDTVKLNVLKHQTDKERHLVITRVCTVA
jgi:hypothetical protein